MNLGDALLWLMGTGGFTFVVSISKICAPFRELFNKRNQVCRFIYNLLTCPLCLGIWAGLILLIVHDHFHPVYRYITYPCSTSLFAWFAYKSTIKPVNSNPIVPPVENTNIQNKKQHRGEKNDLY